MHHVRIIETADLSTVRWFELSLSLRRCAAAGRWPSLGTLAPFLASGRDEGADGTEIEWEPFTLTRAEYEEAVRARMGDRAFEIDETDRSWDEWMDHVPALAGDELPRVAVARERPGGSTSAPFLHPRLTKLFSLLLGAVTAASLVRIPHEVYGLSPSIAYPAAALLAIAGVVLTLRWLRVADPEVGVVFPLLGLSLGVSVVGDALVDDPYAALPLFLVVPPLGVMFGRVFARGWRATPPFA